jgi:hypothetical protein
MVHTDLPQSELGYFADLALKTRSQKIKSVNFVPPLIKPWAYDAGFVRDQVKATVTASEKSGEKPRKTAAAPTRKAKAPAPSGSGSTAAPRNTGTGAQDPGARASGGQAAESDLASVCSAP